MRCTATLVFCLCCLSGALAADGAKTSQQKQVKADDRPPVVSPERFAHEMWLVMELVEKNHVQPSKRAELIVQSLQAVGLSAEKDLGARAQAVRTVEDYATLIKEAWPKQRPDKGLLAVATEAELFRAVVPRTSANTSYVPMDDFKILDQLNNNRYVGTGIQIRLNAQEQLPEILFCFPGGPARRAGVKSGDLIVGVDNREVPKERALQKVVEMLRGEEGTEVTMVIRQPGSTEKRACKMVRSVVPFETLSGYKRSAEDVWDYHVVDAEPIAYLHMNAIKSSTLHELRQLEPKLKAAGFRALILDLRACQADDLHHAEITADGLLDGGVLWRVRDRQGRVKDSLADRDCLFRSWPMVVLVNTEIQGNGAEMLAAVLQDRSRAVLVGEPTRGDRNVRTFVSLPEGKGYLRMPTGIIERATDAERKVDLSSAPLSPVRPDQVVKMDQKSRAKWHEWRRAQEVSQNFNAASPDDPQLQKAVEIALEALKKATP